jgi:hypothetical protein
MNEDMPWVNLTQEEVNELRSKKYELSEYGKQRLREMLTHEEMLEEAERRERSNSVLARYNNYYNIECAALAHGTPITPEFQQAMALECMVSALRCENLNREYNEIAISDIEDLIEGLYNQGRESLKKWEEFKDSADGVA